MSRLIASLLSAIVLIAPIAAMATDNSVGQERGVKALRTAAPLPWMAQCNGDNGQTGTCMNRNDCTNRGGSPSGACANRLGVCCTASLNCNQTNRLKRFVLTHTTGLQSPCTYTIAPTSNLVCQLRIDFEHFQLAPPSMVPNAIGGDTVQCVVDSFNVNGLKLCGQNSGQHIYVAFNSTNGNGIELRFNLANRMLHTTLPMPSWRLRITQLECPLSHNRVQRSLQQEIENHREARTVHSPRPDIDDAFWVAPHGCLQYFPEPNGVFESFNFNNGQGIYFGNMRYSICFRRILTDNELRLTPQTFILPRTVIQTGPNEGYDEACYSSVATPSRHEDYLFISEGSRTVEPMIRASRFCGQGIQGTTIIASQPGPFAIHFNSDDHYEPPNGGVNPDNFETGFRINYQIV